MHFWNRQKILMYKETVFLMSMLSLCVYYDLYGMFKVNLQSDHIEWFFKVLSDKFSYESSRNIWRLLGNFGNHNILSQKLFWLLFGQSLEKFVCSTNYIWWHCKSMIRPQPHYRVKDKCEATNWKQNSQNLVRNLYLYRIRQLQDAAVVET